MKAILILAFLVTGCGLSAQERMAVYSQSCAAYGFTPNTQSWSECIQEQDSRYIDSYHRRKQEYLDIWRHEDHKRRDRY